MRKDNFLVYAGVLVLASLLQSTLLRGIAIYKVQADFTLILLVFFAHQLGSFRGKLLGFGAGLVVDFLGMAPLGFHSFIYTLIGHLFGLTRGKVYIDAVLLPVLLIVAAGLIRIVTAFLLAAVFIPAKTGEVFTAGAFLQIGLHAVLAPMLFALLKLLHLCREHETQINRL
jgi:rod shape-determining protein MreD